MKHSNLLPENNKMPIVRIAPVCNGKIYVVPRHVEREKTLMDLPIEETIEQPSPPSNRMASKIREKYNRHIQTSVSPRFCVKYTSPYQGNIIYLYILPLQAEDEIHFQNGEFIEADEIGSHGEIYSPNLQKEGNLLGMAAELWNDYQTELCQNKKTSP